MLTPFSRDPLSLNPGCQRKRVNSNMVVSSDLPGMEEASRSVFPAADPKLGIVPAMRGFRRKRVRRDGREVSTLLRSACEASFREEDEARLEEFADARKKRYPGLVRFLRENLSRLTAFVKYPEAVRFSIRTADQLERIRREAKGRRRVIRVFSSGGSLRSIVYLILRSENEKPARRRVEGSRNLEWEEGRCRDAMKLTLPEYGQHRHPKSVRLLKIYSWFPQVRGFAGEVGLGARLFSSFQESFFGGVP